VEGESLTGSIGKRVVPSEDPIWWIPRLLTKANSVWLGLTYPFDGFGRRVSVHYSCVIRRSYAHKIRIGDFVILDPDVWFNVPLISEGAEPAIMIGNGCSIGRRSVISARNRIQLEEDVLLAPAVYLTDHNHEYSNTEIAISKQGISSGGNIRIERNCWLGYGSMILGAKGDVVVGRNSVVGAYSVVTESCPPYSVLAGNPAKVVKRFDIDSGTWIKTDGSRRFRNVDSY
jgi:acetyltransferase-like isoleucine patch superfamily enzyme